MIIIGIVLCTLGIFIFYFALRGGLISNNPHCQGCKFDLVGLELNRDSICPECGKPIVPDTPTIQIGLRKRRPIIATLALLLILAGGVGIAWPTVSQMPSIKNIDWYAKFPESMLLKLEASSNKKALQTLHDRLIPGTLSDEGLNELVGRAFAIQADESVVWDERWGDVLLYAFLLDRMSHENALGYLERSIQFEVKVHKQIGFDTSSVRYTLIELEPVRGTWSFAFGNDLNQALPTVQYGGLITGFHDRFESFRPYENEQDRRNGSFSGGSALSMDEYAGSWLPYKRRSSRAVTRLDLDIDRNEFSFIFPIQITIYKDKAVFHDWLIEKKVHITRVENPQYLKPFQDDEVIQELAQSLEMGPIMVPTNPQESKQHKDLTSSISTIMSLNCSIEKDLGLLGRFVLDNGDEQIEFGTLTIPMLRVTRYGFYTPKPWQFPRNWLDFYTEHESFWEIARENGTIDVIYMPDLSIGLDDAQYELVIDRKIIWRHVPVDHHEVRPMNFIERDGMERVGVGLEPVASPRVGESYISAEFQARRERLQPIQGELLEEDESQGVLP